MKVHLNKAFVSRIKCEESKSKQEFNDIQMIGFFLEVRKNGKKTYFLRTKNSNGKRVCVKVGDAKIIKLEDARAKAIKLKRKVESQVDNLTLKAEDSEQRITFAEFYNDQLFLDASGNVCHHQYPNTLFSMSSSYALKSENTGTVYLKEILLFDKKIKPTASHVFKHNDNNITLSFGYLNTSDFATPLLEYKINTADWLTLPQNHTLSLFNLSSGDYQITVRNKNNPSSLYSVNFKIGKIWWQTVWFFIGLILSTSTILLGLYKNRVQKVRKEETLKNEFQQRISGDGLPNGRGFCRAIRCQIRGRRDTRGSPLNDSFQHPRNLGFKVFDFLPNHSQRTRRGILVKMPREGDFIADFDFLKINPRIRTVRQHLALEVGIAMFPHQRNQFRLAVLFVVTDRQR